MIETDPVNLFRLNKIQDALQVVHRADAVVFPQQGDGLRPQPLNFEQLQRRGRVLLQELVAATPIIVNLVDLREELDVFVDAEVAVEREPLGEVADLLGQGGEGRGLLRRRVMPLMFKSIS